MPPTIRTAFESELTTARRATDLDSRWHALERAHILSQHWPWPHTRAHWHMFRLALRTRDRPEILGQIIRLAVAGPGSALGRAPLGNTGRSSVGITTPMPLPADLARILTDGGIPLTR
ncbi:MULTISPECIES: DUF3703 domain-containing protein [unclassified Nocardia]|uniref:DUF3703 domain-containing protein n=1 Tax=unclassified Nocardia TaxID=2637762 RepID=UPI0024A7FEEB|nr:MULTISPECIES: DUF3703 domain-containing protein [unclassified Nocardia]